MCDHKIQLLQNIPVFGGINAATIKLVLKLSLPVQIQRGDSFFSEGDLGCSMFILQKGKAAVVKSSGCKEHFIRHINEGDCFGEMAIIDHYPRSATVRAEVDTAAIEVPSSALLEVYKQDIEQFTMIQMNMGREVSRRLREVSDRLFEYQLKQDAKHNASAPTV